MSWQVLEIPSVLQDLGSLGNVTNSGLVQTHKKSTGIPQTQRFWENTWRPHTQIPHKGNVVLLSLLLRTQRQHPRLPIQLINLPRLPRT